MITYYIKCYLEGDNIIANKGYKNMTDLLHKAGNEFYICPVAVKLNIHHHLSDAELKILTEQKCVMDALLAANSVPYYIIFKSTIDDT